VSLEIKVGPFTLGGEPGGHVDVWDEVNRIAAKVPSAHVGSLAEALLAFVVAPATPAAKPPKPVECRTCHALMFWAATPAGGRMPVNAEPDPAGKLVMNLHPDGLHVESWRADEPKHAAPRRRWTSHFATCAQAAEHRRPR